MEQYRFVTVNIPGARDVPAVVLSPTYMNQELPTIIIAPIIKNMQSYPTRVPIKVSGQRGWVAVEQLRNIEKNRVISIHGLLSSREAEDVKVALQFLLLS